MSIHALSLMAQLPRTGCFPARTLEWGAQGLPAFCWAVKVLAGLWSLRPERK